MKTDYLTLPDLAAILKKRLLPILLASLILAMGGFAIRALLPATYSATATFYVRNLQSEAFLEANGLTSSQLASVQTLAKEYAMLTEESDALADRIIARHGISLSRDELRDMLTAKAESTTFHVTATARDAAAADAVIAAVEVELPLLIQETAWPNLPHREQVVVLLREASPATRASLHPVTVSLLSFAVGLVLAYLFFVLYFLFSNRVTDTQELARVLPSTPILAEIPRILPPGDPAEAFYALRERLPRAKGGAVSLAITSPTAGEGKSYVATELARSLATAGHKVLLIDADLRRTVREEPLDTDPVPGFAEYLGGKEKDPLSLTHETEKSGLSLLSAGVVPLSPCDHALGEKMSALLAAYGAQYEYILADFPAVGDFADAIACVRDFTHTLLVAAPPRSGACELRAALGTVTEAGGKVLGVVANQPPKHRP